MESADSSKYTGSQSQRRRNHVLESQIVVSGISGRFPESENMDEFWKNLYDGVDMVTDDDRRWTPGIFGLPKRSGKLKELDKFDAGFFGVHPKQASFMDPQLRMLMEVTYEAIVDAGVNPAQVRGSRTGVFVGASSSESEKEWLKDSEDTRHGYTSVGCHRTMFSNRISFAFDFHGPSFTVDTGCSASFVALEQAVASIRLGHCDSAIVGGTHLCLEPEMTLQYHRFNMLSPDGKCKSFDAEGNGYVRSEAVVAIFIQKKDVAQRSYASILAARTNTDGFKEKGITFPSGQRQKELLEETYKEAGVNPNDVVYFETHGTGTPAGDPQELSAIAQVLCKNRDENNPLLIGSVKSNMGHSEASSGLCGMAKVLLAFQNGIIPANLHFKNPNPNITPLIDGRLKVVAQHMPWRSGIVGLNSFGFGGTNVHVILQFEQEAISQKQQPKADNSYSLPLIIPFSGRTKESVDGGLKKIRNFLQEKNYVTTAATIALLHEIFQERNEKHQLCGFSLFRGNSQHSIETIQVAAQENSTKRPPTWLIFNGMGSQWLGFANELFKFSTFSESIQNSTETLKNNKVDLKSILFSDNEKILDDVTNSFLIITAVQIALVDLLSSLGIKPDGIVGHSVGELGAAYADGCLTLEQAILAALARGQAIAESPSDQKCGMAAVGMSWDAAKSKCPPNVYLACHNSKDSVTISGPLDDIQNFVEQLKTEGIFAKEVASSGRAFHSKYIEYARPKLKTLLDEILPDPKPRSSRWKSTSIPESEWNSNLAQTSSADYHVNNLISPVLFHEALRHVPDSAVVIEIGPHCLLQSILKRSLPACTHIALINKNSKDLTGFLCQAIGKMYNCGLNPNFKNLYPPVEFPVSCSVPSLSSLISWDHEKSWNVPSFDPVKRKQNENHNNPGQTVFEISLSEETDKFYVGHKIDGRIIFPATGYLCLVWRAFAQLQSKPFDHVSVVFENVEIQKNTVLSEIANAVKFSITISKTTGEFQLKEDDTILVTGVVRSPNGNEFESLDDGMGDKNQEHVLPMDNKDVYKEFRLRGYEYGGKFQGIFTLDATNGRGEVEWLENWVTLLNSMIQTALLSRPTRALLLPTEIDKLVLEPQIFLQSLNSRNKVPVFHDNLLNIVTCEGIQLERCNFEVVPKNNSGKVSGSLKLERFQFTPYFDDINNFTGNDKLTNNLKDPDPETEIQRNFRTETDICLGTCVQIVLENISENTLKMTEIIEDTNSSAFSASLALSIQSHVLQQPTKLFSGKIIVKKGNQKHDDNLKTFKETGIPVVTVEDQKKLDDETYADLVVMTYENCLPNSLPTTFLQIEKFLLLHSKNCKTVNVQEVEKYFGLVLVAQKCSQRASFFLFKKALNYSTVSKTVITIDLKPTAENGDKTPASNFNYDWVESLKEAMKSEQESTSEEDKKIYVVSRNSPDHPSGVLGLINCLRKEPGGKNIRSFFLKGDSDLQLDFDNPDEFLAARLQQDLVHNVFDSSLNVWGSYRFFPLRPQGQPVTKKVEHGFLNIRTKGDLSTFQWLESPLKYHEPQSDLCKVHYAALNFRDVMLCTGKLSLDSLPNNQGLQESVLGLEFSGKTSTGKKMMGFLPNARAFATSVIPDPGFSWDVPDSWTLAEAATAPVVYCTAFYALLIRGKMREGESILIHSGAGGVGQAAISIALSMKCKVFTTVSNKEKREFLQKTFPQLDDFCFANSRDSSFLNHILKQTDGKGVDLVLNSLAGDLLHTSVKCLRQHGRFLEIGKVDLFNNSNLGMSVLLKDVSVHGILLDSLESGTQHQRKLWKLMDNGIKSGVVQPLSFTKFSDSTEDIEKAFRFMASGKHVGKVLIQICDEDEEPSNKIVQVHPQSYFDPSKSYIVVGGLGGFGLELCGWLVERGVRKLVIVSRSGVRTGFQDFQISKWRQVNGVSVFVSTEDVTTTDGASSLLKTVLNYFKSPIGGIFNLAMVLRDGVMEHQTPENFQVVSRPKVNAAMALDKVSRELAPSLEYFVVFSSTSSGVGFMGLSSYAWANSASERICENRRKFGFPALAIMWGAIGDVGVLQESLKLGNDAIVGGTNLQPISSCLQVLDVLLHESKSPHFQILSSMVLPEQSQTSTKKGPGLNETNQKEESNLSHQVAHILGMKSVDLENVNTDARLVDLGLDSLMQIEVKQLFEVTCGAILSPRDVSDLTFKHIQNMDKNYNATSEASEENIGAIVHKECAEGELSQAIVIRPDSIISERTCTLKQTHAPFGTNSKEVADCRSPSLLSGGKSKQSRIQGDSCANKTPKNESHEKILLFVSSAGSYLVGLLAIMVLLTLCVLSLFIRLIVKLHLKLFYPPNQIKLVSRPLDQICAANPRGSNMTFCLKFTGSPDKNRILRTLQEKVVDWKTNISFCKDVNPDFYEPYESLSWKLTHGFFFNYWTKVNHLNVEDHLVFQEYSESDSMEFDNETSRLSEMYHGHKWDDSRPQWEFRVISPNNSQFHPPEYEFKSKSKEFYLIFATHHAYGDAFSFYNMLQYALRGDSRGVSAATVSKSDSAEAEKYAGKSEKSKSKSIQWRNNLNQVLKLAPFVQDHFIRLHHMILEMSRVQELCRDYDFCPEPDSARHCGFGKFSLSTVKNVKNRMTGERSSVNAVMLTCISRAYERIYKDASNSNSNKNLKFSLPKNLVAMMPFAVADSQPKRLEMSNNFSHSYTAVPTQIPDISERLNEIQKNIEDSSTQERLGTSSDFNRLVSLLPNPVFRMLIPLLYSPSFVYSSVPVTVPKDFTFFGGHGLKDKFGYTMLVSRTHGAFTCSIDSANDCINLSYVVDSSAFILAPDYLNTFFHYFQQELEVLVAVGTF